MADDGGPVPAKICGLTRPEDAELAARLRARWLGVIFAGGPREITPARAREICRSVPGVPVIGVFATLDPVAILRIRDQAGISGAQLHGGVTPQTVERLHQEGMKVLQVARLASHEDVAGLAPLKRNGAPVLVEPRVATALGGSGTPLADSLAVEARAALEGHFMFLAGGLNPETVGPLVRRVRPDAVDVSSGVEQIPGIKDAGRLTRFMEVLGWA